MRTRYISPALACAFVLTGCALGPDYNRPPEAKINQVVSGEKLQGSQTSAFSQAEAPHDWWHLYNDPVLDGIIQQTIIRNADLRIAAANVRRADAYLAQIEDRKLPQASVTGNAGYGELSAEEHLQFGTPLPADFMYSVEGALTYQFDLFGQVQRAVEATKADTATSRAEYHSVKINIIAEATRAYLETCSVGHEIEIATSIAASQDRLNSANEKLIALGRVASTTREPMNVQQARFRAAIPALQARQKAASYRLAALMGMLPAELPSSVQSCHQAPVLTNPLPTGDGRALLQRRPDVQAAEETLHSATADIGVVTADLYPHIYLGISGGSTGLASHFGNSDTFKYSLGPLISWNFPNRGMAKARIHQAEARADAAYANFDKTVLNALRDTESALVLYARDLDQNNDLKRAAVGRARFSDETKKLHMLGRENVITTLEAERNYLLAEQDVAASDSKILADQVSLFHVLGGGW